jgi:hypothetical protein
MRAAEIIGREGVEPFVAVAALETLDAEAQPLDPRRDHGAERRRLGTEMGIECARGEARGLSQPVDADAAKAMHAECASGRVEHALSGGFGLFGTIAQGGFSSSMA